MHTYQGIYTYDSPDNTRSAEVIVSRKRISIRLPDGRQVYWYWHDIKRENGILQYAGLPLQRLRVQSADFDTQVDKFLQARRWPFMRLVMAIFFVLALMVSLYFLLIPFLTSRAVDKIPVSYEVKFGEEAYQSMIGEFTVMEKESVLVNNFFKVMQIDSPYPIYITVVRKEETNAFAIPGGHIVVFSGLLNKMKRPEELAALLAHEYSHIALRHTTRSLMQSLGTYTIAALIFGDLTGVGAVMLENAHTLRRLQYSRGLEQEADLQGLRLLQERKINGEGFIWLFGTLGEGGGSVEWLSSHPDLKNRAAYVQKALQGHQPIPAPAALQTIWAAIKKQAS